MKLSRGSHTCAIGIHILLEEIDALGGATKQGWFKCWMTGERSPSSGQSMSGWRE